MTAHVCKVRDASRETIAYERAQARSEMLQLVDAWSSLDDWGVDVITVATLRDLVEAVANGDNRHALARHATHVLADCRQARCVDRIPFTIARDERLARLLQETSISLSRDTKARDLDTAIAVADQMEDE